MDRIFTIKSKDLDNRYIVERSITIKVPKEKFEELVEMAIEVDDNIEELLQCIVENNLLDKMENKDFKQLLMDAYYSHLVEC